MWGSCLRGFFGDWDYELWSIGWLVKERGNDKKWLYDRVLELYQIKLFALILSKQNESLIIQMFNQYIYFI